MTDQPMKITALAPWFGGKRTLAPTIVEELGPHSSYWEPFCGSMAVLLAKTETSHENVNDLHGDLINLALTIQDAKHGAELYRAARRILLHEDLYKQARSRLRQRPEWSGSSPDPSRALEYLVVSWMGRSGISGLRLSEGAKGFCVRWTNNGGSAATRWRKVVESLPAWRRRMRNVTILRRDGFEVIAKIADAENTAVYVDGPYLAKSDSYVHDFDIADHQRLADLLARFTSARVVVSYYDDPRLDELYPGWTIRKVYRAKALSLQNKRGATATIAPEVLLINGPSLATRPAETLLFGDPQ